MSNVIIEYPCEWKPPIEFKNHSLYRKTIAENTIKWLREYKVADEDIIKKLNIESYSGCSSIFHNYIHSFIHSKFIVLWIIWDDVIVGKETNLAHICQMDRIMRGDEYWPIGHFYKDSIKYSSEKCKKFFGDFDYIKPTISDEKYNNYAKAWYSVMQEIFNVCHFSYSIKMKYLNRFGDNFMEWMYHAHEEQKETTLLHRQMTIGMINTAQLLELACGIDLTDICQEKDFQNIVMNSCTLVGIDNDIFSLHKDTKDEKHNTILNLKKDVSLKEAINIGLDIHNNAILNFDNLCKNYTSEILQSYFYQLRMMTYGFAYWSSHADRYMSEIKILVN